MLATPLRAYALREALAATGLAASTWEALRANKKATFRLTCEEPPAQTLLPPGDPFWTQTLWGGLIWTLEDVTRLAAVMEMRKAGIPTTVGAGKLLNMPWPGRPLYLTVATGLTDGELVTVKVHSDEVGRDRVLYLSPAAIVINLAMLRKIMLAGLSGEEEQKQALEVPIQAKAGKHAVVVDIGGTNYALTVEAAGTLANQLNKAADALCVVELPVNEERES